MTPPPVIAAAPSPVRGEDTSPEAAIAHARAPHAAIENEPQSKHRDAPDDEAAVHSVPSLVARTDNDPARSALALLVELAATRGQLLLCGRPGSGTAAWTEAVAAALRHGDGLSERLVFHPGWTRADFLQGVDTHGNRRAGRFMEFCRRTAERKGRSVLAIHAIQRADADAVFGEALGLLDLRDVECSLSGSGNLSVPGQLVILAGCDTADGLLPDAPAFTQHFACAFVPELPPPRAQ